MQFGPYEVITRLGAGGMGEVFRARDTRLDRQVALKVLPLDRVADAEARGRFEREARAIAALNHPNICAIHDVGLGEASQPPYLVMELLEGHTLQERLLKGPIEIELIVEYGAALADALDTAHGRGLIHRDLKPANIFLTSRGIPKILDFGLAKTMADAGSDVTRKSDDLTEMGTTVGTIAYMSPEQLRAESLDARSDLFSFGLVLYEMATGQRAFSGVTSAVVSAAILAQEPAAPRNARPELPARLDEIILKCLEKDRTLRCQSAAELRADLTRLRRQSGSQISRTVAGTASSPTATAVPAGEVLTPTRPAVAATPTVTATAVTGSAAAAAGSNRSLWLAIAAVAVLAIGIGAYTMFSGGVQSSPPAPPETVVQPRPAEPSAPAVRPPPAPPPADVTPNPTGAAAVPLVPAPRGGRPGGGPGGGPGAGPGRRVIAGGPALAAILQKLPPLPFDIGYAAGDDRAREMAFQLRGALVAGGWTAVSMGEIPAPPAPLAVFLPQRTPASDALISWARRNGHNPEVRPNTRIPRLRIVIGR